MKKTIILLFTILALCSIVPTVYAADGYTSCLDSIRDIGVAPTSCFAKSYRLAPATFSSSNCNGAVGNIRVIPTGGGVCAGTFAAAGTICDDNDASAVGAQCPQACTADETQGTCTTANGQIILDMGVGGIITLGGTTTDFYVNEGGVLERFSVAVSNFPNGPWTSLGASCQGVAGGWQKPFQTVGGKNFYEFNIPGAASLTYRYVRITTTQTDAGKQCDGTTLPKENYGSDIGWVLAARVECTNECNIGEQGCNGGSAQWTCGEANDKDTCLDKIVTNCPIGNACTTPPGSCSSTCVPKTCSQLGKECGSWSDTCSGTLTCGNNGDCSNPGNYCTTTGQCNALSAQTTFTCSGASGTLAAESAVPPNVQLKYYADNIPQPTQTVPNNNGPFSFTLAPPFADDAVHDFRITAIISDAAGEYELARRDDLLCPTIIAPGDCELKNIAWDDTCVEAGTPIELSGETVASCLEPTTVTFEVWEKDTGPDDHMKPDPAKDIVQTGESDFSTEWNAQWQDDEVSKDPIYYAKAIGPKNTVITTGTPLSVQPCNHATDEDCDDVANYIDKCPGSAQCAVVDSNGCEHNSQQQLCESLWDCSNLEWSTCTDGKITRDICKTGSGGIAPTCCSDINNYGSQCACVFTGDIATQFSLCQQYAPETERSCLIEEPFPIFTWVNALLVSVLLAGYYFVRRKY